MAEVAAEVVDNLAAVVAVKAADCDAVAKRSKSSFVTEVLILVDNMLPSCSRTSYCMSISMLWSVWQPRR